MAPVEAREAQTTQMSTTALAAILTGAGVVMLGLFIGLVALLVRAVKTHKKLLADLEERGVAIAQIQKEDKGDGVTRPRAVLRRNTIMPYGTRSGWGTLPSVETIESSTSSIIPPHYVPPKPAGFVSKSKRLSWPFSARRSSGRAIHMRKIRAPVLSTVIESPKPSPIVPVVCGLQHYSPTSPTKSPSQHRLSSDQSLLQHHPALRDVKTSLGTERRSDDLRLESLRRSFTASDLVQAEHSSPLKRSQSVIEALSKGRPALISRSMRPKIHERSASTCSQASGHAPSSELPPLPLDVARAKSQAKRNSLLSRSPSRLSISSYESVGSSILATQSSPVIRGTNPRSHRIAKRRWGNPNITGPRPLRDTLTLHGRNLDSPSSVKSSAVQFGTTVPDVTSEFRIPSKGSLLSTSSSSQSIGKINTAESVTLNRVLSPSGSPLHKERIKTPKRRSQIHVTPFGSPEDRRKRASVLRGATNLHDGPQRQDSQASSTRSSNGNPFQWDPVPMAAGKPSALKGSPCARKGIKRGHSVRISLTPIVLGPSSRATSPLRKHEVSTTSPNNVVSKRHSMPPAPPTRSLPRPPSSSTFAPDLKFNATAIRASLNPSSPTLSMASYDHGPIGSPVISPKSTGASHSPSNGMSSNSFFNIPKFPSPCRGTPARSIVTSSPLNFGFGLPSKEKSLKLKSPGASSPVETLGEFPSSPGRVPLMEEYDPDRPHLGFRTSASIPIHEDTHSLPRLSATSPNGSHTLPPHHVQAPAEDSPPCSPKTVRNPTWTFLPDETSYDASAQGEAPLNEYSDSIDPAMLDLNAFASLNMPYDGTTNDYMNSPQFREFHISMPSDIGSAETVINPLLDTALPHSPPPSSEQPPSPATKKSRRNAQAHLDPSTSLHYLAISNSMAMLSPPCSPRPAHAELPIPSLNFDAMPNLSPLLSGPRDSPGRPLRSSIQKLRRMNSDAEKGGKEERRYLRLGREASIALPGEESWLEGLDEDATGCGANDEDGEVWDEKRLVGDILENWEEEAAMLEERDDLDHAVVSFQDTTQQQNPSRHNDTQDSSASGSSTPKAGSPQPGPDVSFVRRSSIWEDGESFWATSSPPAPPSTSITSPNKPRKQFLPLSSPTLPAMPEFENAMAQNLPSSKKQIAKGDVDGGAPLQEDIVMMSHDEAVDPNDQKKKHALPPTEKRKSVGPSTGTTGKATRKRRVLGVSTPNASPRIMVQPPSSGVRSDTGGNGSGVGADTPGSLYDGDGFLRV